MKHLTLSSSANAPRTAGLAAAALALAVVAITTLSTPSVTHAAQVPSAITSVTTDKTSYGYNERIKLAFDWVVPDSSIAGDTFALALPEELKAGSLARFSLLSSDGTAVANAAWDGKSIIFTLTDYVESHDGVSGTGFVSVQWDHAFTPETSQPIVLNFSGQAVEVTIGDKPAPPQPCTVDCPPTPATPTERSLSKSGGWADGAYEGTRDETGNISWSIALPGDQSGYTGPIEVVDTPRAGSIIECSTISVLAQSSLAGGTPRMPVDPGRYTIDCSAEVFTIHLDEVAPSEFITITYKGTITDQRPGSYGNEVELTIAGTTTMKETTIRRTDAGGVGGGSQSVSVGDYVWLDADANGIQGVTEKGIPGVTLTLSGPHGGTVTDVNGRVVNAAVTDATGGYTFRQLPVLPAGQHYTVTIDQSASGIALEGLTPTVTATGDRATDSSTGSAESVDLVTNGARDDTLDFGYVFEQLPTLPLPVDPTDSDLTLAHTGSDTLPLGLVGAAALLVVGMAGILLSRRRTA